MSDQKKKKRRLLNPLHNHTNWVHYDKAVPVHACEQLLARRGMSRWDKGTIRANEQAPQEIRHNEVQWIKREECEDKSDLQFWEAINQAACDANQHRWRFDCEEFDGSIQLAQYRADGGNHHYSWHLDWGNAGSSIRKLTVVVQLSPISAYEGGYLEFRTDSEIARAPRAQGTILVFPSFILHRVTPVTDGTRHSLTAWIEGPPLK